LTILTFRTGAAGGGAWSREGNGRVECGDWPRVYLKDKERTGVLVRFEMSAAGRGHTLAVLGIEPSSFEDLARAMIRADQAAALRAFGRALVAVSSGAGPSEAGT